jgi:hypothetical protein
MRALRATALVLVATLLPAACGKSEERKSLNVNTLTEAGASLALTIGEVVERYAAELPTGDALQDQERLRAIFRDGAGSLATGDVTSSFTAAAVDSREKGNSKGETARQLLSAAMLAGLAFEKPRADYKPGDQAMRDDIAFYFAQNSGAQLSATYGLHSGGWKASNPEKLATALAEATRLSLLVACYNYAGPDGYRSIRNRMRRLDMPLAPDYWVGDAGNLTLPDGDGSDDQIELFDEWREPSKGTNPLWSAVLGPDRQALAEVFQPAAEKAFD